MSALKRGAIAAVAAAWIAGAGADERVFGAIESMDNDKRGNAGAPIDTAELARAVDSGEIRTMEDTTDGVREYMHEAAGQTRAPEERPRPAARYAPGEARAPVKAPAPLMDDAARAAEHIKYEAEKKRRGG